MSKAKHRHSMLSTLVDSDSDDAQFVEASIMPTPDSAAENKAPVKKGRGRPKAVAGAKVTKAKPPARRSSGRIEAKSKAVAPPKGKRKALTDKTNQPYGSDTEEVDDFEQDDIAMAEAPVAVEETKPKATRKKAPGRGKIAQEVSANTNYSIDDVTPHAPMLKSGPAKRKPTAKRQPPSAPSPEKVVMESQIPVMDIDEGEVVKSSDFRAARAPSQSRPRQPSVQRRRAGSASDTERNDPALRRKLGEMTKKYDNLSVKYQDLREIGLKEAERNFERLKKQNEERTAASDKLIASLKAEAASHSALAKESRGLKKKVESQVAETATLKAQMAQMKTSLEEARAQNKTLSTKLAANRTAAASVESASTKVPSSAVKANGGIRMMGTAEAAQAAQAAQLLKEDVYSDLTGLIIRGVKREAEDDVFDCIQTGRNGTLHFKLAAANEKSAESYDDAQCQYVPQLDPNRDRALMELLPDYLVDEISFPRQQSAKFYARVVKALTERVD